MPIDSRTTRRARVGRLRTSAAARAVARLLPLVVALGAHPLGAQSTPVRSPDAWSVEAHYLQLAPASTGRDATPSLGVAIGRRLEVGSQDWRVEGGWSRAVHGVTTAQGATLGLTAGTIATGRLAVRPGVALLAGWAESQDSSALYAWRGVAGTADAGTAGTRYDWSTIRSRTIGLGASVAAELRLTRSLALSASLRQWRFGGSGAAANRSVTLAGAGLVARPGALVLGARRLWHAARSGARLQAAANDAPAGLDVGDALFVEE